MSVINKETKLRASVSRKSSIVRDMAKDDSVVIAAEAEAKGKESWLKVFTKDGYIGFIEKKYVSSDYKEEARYSSFEKPNYTNIVLEKPIVLSWHQITNMEANSGLSKTLENTSGLTVISPTWFSLSDNEGNYTSLADAGYVKEAHSKGLQVWVLIDNLSDKVKSEILLSHSERRKKIIDKLIKDVKTYDIDGIKH